MATDTRLAARGRASLSLQANGYALNCLDNPARVHAHVRTQFGPAQMVDFSEEPLVIAAIKQVCLERIAEANRQMLALGGHLLQ